MVAPDKNGSKLGILLAAAAALPGVATPASAQVTDTSTRSDSVRFGYNHSEYDESDGRMSVRADQLSITVPVGSRWEVGAQYVRDVVSGASPFAYLPGGDGEPEPLLSRASIYDERDVFDGTIRYFGDNDLVSLNVGRSQEDDYISNFGSIEWSHYLNDKSTTLTAAAAYADDLVWNSFGPTDRFMSPPVYQDREKIDLTAGVTQVMDKFSLASASVTYSHASGGLADPYKRALVFGRGFVADNRPDNHTQWALNARYDRYIPELNGALKISYRRIEDSWDADSNTVTLSWGQEIGEKVTLTPNLRWYQQENAFFYGPIYTSLRADGLVTSDYRLASFETVTAGVEASVFITDGIVLSAQYQHFERGRDLIIRPGGVGFDSDDFSAQIWMVELNAGF